MDLKKIDTERNNEKSRDFSSMSIKDSVSLMNKEDIKAVQCIEPEIDKITKVIEYTSQALKNKNRIIYIGAGTSGRLGVLDAVECPPTFGVDYDTVVGLIAGGDGAFVKAKEGSEDTFLEAENDLKKINFIKDDILIGIAASGRTPYVIGAIEYAKSLGAHAFAVVATKNSEIKNHADITIEVVPGPEVLTGSTRLKAGTATKLVLNMISTISMKEMGKVYQNYMVDLKLSNKKLYQRGINILRDITSCDEEMAIKVLEASNCHVKAGIVMILLGVDYETAINKLDNNNGIIDEVIHK
ncbi:N-acetylmuramic acid 6-phosphate etherase [Helcococcus ovis]|uniref:N-acetylmuramic acid 6-phosphate etherase n=1 Tax=Helcococcus ovis TaxID=72026 RepID=UPI0038BA6553